MSRRKPKGLNKPKISKPKKALNKRWLEGFLIGFFLSLGALFRILHLQGIESNDPTFYSLPYGTDMVTYDNQAQDILKGKHPAPYYYGPLYPYFLSLIYLIFGHNLYIPRLIQMVIGVFTCFFIFLVAKRVFGRAVAIISLGLSCFYDMFIIHEGLLLLEALATFLNIVLIFFLIKFQETRKLKDIILSGIFLALSALSRASILLFLPFVFIWMLAFFKKRAFFYFFVFSTTAFIFISPATIMNYIATKKFILISTSGPINFWIGNNEKADGTYLAVPHPKRLEKRLKEIGDRAYIEDVIRFIKEKPKEFIKLTLRKFFLFWGAFEVANNMNYNQIKGWSSIMKYPFFIGFGTIAPLALFGIFLSLRNRKTLLLNLFVLSFMGGMVAMFVLGRYRINFLPILIIFAGYSILWLYERVKEKGYIRILKTLPIFLLFLLLVWHKEIYGICFPFINPNGIHREENGITIIKDCGDEWRGGDAVFLRNGDRVKKELIIKEDLSLYKSAEVSFKYSGDGSPVLTLGVNNSYSLPMRFTLSTQGLVKAFSCPIPINLLKKGENSFELKLDGNALFALLYDTTYSFGRSYQFKENGFKKIKKGEFMVWLSLLK